MCSISVEPMPSRMSLPKRAFHASPTWRGRASPADVQARRLDDRRRVGEGGVGEHRRVERRDAVEDRRLVSRARGVTASGVGRSAISTAVAPTESGKVSELPRPYAKKSLDAEKTTSSLVMPEHALRVERRRLDQVRVQVDRALGRAGRARGVEPERDVVGGGRRGLELGRRLRRSPCRSAATRRLDRRAASAPPSCCGARGRSRLRRGASAAARR